MNGGDWTVIRSAKLRDVTIELTFGPGGFSCAWLPSLPDREFSKMERRRYREARDAMLDAVAERLGIAPKVRLVA